MTFQVPVSNTPAMGTALVQITVLATGATFYISSDMNKNLAQGFGPQVKNNARLIKAYDVMPLGTPGGAVLDVSGSVKDVSLNPASPGTLAMNNLPAAYILSVTMVDAIHGTRVATIRLIRSDGGYFYGEGQSILVGGEANAFYSVILTEQNK
ncbi:MAG TPA: hypothetical protein VG603_01755 [Chitinophagales bacterium]|nr:hypothetical protein [Chitinophagales bacterium]